MEQIALAVISSAAAGLLVAELRAPLDRQSLMSSKDKKKGYDVKKEEEGNRNWTTLKRAGKYLVGVDECFANGKAVARGTFKMNADKCSSHRWIARQEERTPFFNEPSEAVTDGIHPHVGTAVSYSYNDCGRLPVLCHSKRNDNKLGAKVDEKNFITDIKD